MAVQSCEMMSMGMGKMIVLLFSAAMLFNVCKYLSWKEKRGVHERRVFRKEII